MISILLLLILYAYLAVGPFVQLTHQMLQPAVHILVATIVLVPAIHPDCSRNVAVLIDHYMQTLKMICLRLGLPHAGVLTNALDGCVGTQKATA